MNDQKTLRAQALDACRPMGIEPSEAEVTDALRAAGISQSDEKERERFRRLAAEASRFQESEESTWLGPYFEQAEEELLDTGANKNEILLRAWHLWSRREGYRQQIPNNSMPHT